MSKYSLFFLIGLIGGFLIGTTSVHANTRAIGPQPIIPTDISEGTLFVKPNGNGNVCSKANPCNIWAAVNKASAGDVVFLRGGTYAVSKNITFKNRGTAGNPIIFESFPGETVIFDGSQHAKGTKVFFRITGKFIHIRGVEIKNMPREGIMVLGNDNLIEGVHVHHSALTGIQVFSPYEAFPYGAYGSRNIIRHSISHHNSDVGSFPGSSNGGNADGIKVASGADNRLENNLVHSNSDDGLDAWRSTNTYIGYNISHSNGVDNPGGDGNGIKAGGIEPSSGTYVEHNLVYKNRGYGGIMHNKGKNQTYVNNTVWNNVNFSYVLSKEVTARDNIAIGPLGPNRLGTEINNSWQRAGTVAFVSTDSTSPSFLVPKISSGFEDIGAQPPKISVSASIASVIGPQSIIPTDISEGTLFVKPNGNGNICSKANPCNIWTAVNKASAGDVVFLRGGKYAVHKNLTFNNIASAENPIVFENYPGETAVFDGSQHAKGTKVFFRITGKFIHIRGVEIKNMPREGIMVLGNDNLIEGVHVHHNALTGIQVFSPYQAFPYGAYGSRNIIRHSISHHNSDVGSFPGSSNGGNADGIKVASGADNRVENNLVHSNSDEGIDAWKSTNTYIGYNISHSNGINSPNGDGNGITAGGVYPSADALVEHNLSYSNKAVGITHNTAVNVTLYNNTTWNNKTSYTLGSDTVATNNIASETKMFGAGIEIDNSWQRSGSVAFISTDSRSTNFLVPESNNGFEDIGAFANATNKNTANDATTSLPDVVVTQVSYANGIFTSTVKNQGNAATPAGVVVAVGYSVDGKYKTWGGINGTLAAGASATISTNGAPYTIPDGTHTIRAWVDDVNRFEESNESNNQFSRSITIR